MSDYLSGYGAGDVQRERRTKRIILGLLIVLILAGVYFLFFRTFREERVARRFLQTLQAKDFQTAYRMFGCTEQNPCRDYAFERFMKDWGPQGTYADTGRVSFGDVDKCGEGAVLTLHYPGVDPNGLYVDSSTHIIGFAPWPRCPGRHWNFRAAWKNLFGDPEPPPAPGTR